jgi:hypothetical protein
MSMFEQYVDLLSSGDEARIKCVLAAALSGAAAGGLGAGIAFAPANAAPVAGQAINAGAAGIGAVLGALSASKLAMNYCGEGTEGSFDRLFRIGKLDRGSYDGMLRAAQSHFGLGADDARILVKAAAVYSRIGGEGSAEVLPHGNNQIAARTLVDLMKRSGVTA